jgi:hypothetical protein
VGWARTAVAAEQEKREEGKQDRGASHKAIIPNSAYGHVAASNEHVCRLGDCAGTQ